MSYLLMCLLGAVIVFLDQWTKYLTVANIDLFGKADGLPGIFHLTYVQNTGAAWSMFAGMRWLFLAVFVVFAAFVVWEFWKKRLPFTGFDRWCIAAVLAGGLGNIIDRVRLGYVVDMICLDFMEFPVFNVADCFITCGCIALMVSLIFFNKEFWKEEKK